jgi:hypothetical protein
MNPFTATALPNRIMRVRKTTILALDLSGAGMQKPVWEKENKK